PLLASKLEDRQMNAKSIPFFTWLALFLLPMMHAWSQGTEATILGTVSETEGPVSGVSITVKNESTGFKVTTMTNEKGNYTFQQLPLGSPYTVTATYIGYTEQKKTGYTLNYGDELVVDFKLAASSNQLDEVVVQGNDMRNAIKTLGASTAVTATELTKLPVNGRNFSSLIDLSPVSNRNTLAGQIASSTNYTVDGMTSRSTIAGGNSGGAYSISLDVI